MDLETQISVLRHYVVANGNQVDEVFSDVASGMNESRTSFMKLIKLVTSNQVDVVYISYKDRLTRFGFGYFEQLFALFGTEIKVLNSTTESEFQQELTEDLISVIHHFSMVSNHKKQLNELKESLRKSQESQEK